MIRSFRCNETKRLFDDEQGTRFQGIQRIARRKLEMLEAAERLNDLRCPPGNRLKALKGGFAGQYCIRINDQFRVCFRWVTNAAHDVEIVDYH